MDSELPQNPVYSHAEELVGRQVKPPLPQLLNHPLHFLVSHFVLHWLPIQPPIPKNPKTREVQPPRCGYIKLSKFESYRTREPCTAGESLSETQLACRVVGG